MSRVRMSVVSSLILAALLSTPADAGPRAASDLPGLPHVGGPARVENLTVFPIYGRAAAAGRDIISLEAALEAGKALVREVGSKEDQSRRPPIQSFVVDHGGATVGTLVIDNRSDQSILVLGGTVVKGGKQDRQIGQDFVIGPHQ